MTTTIERRDTGWGFAPGDEIAPGLLAQELLGGGTRYEAYVAFDERLYRPVVVKVLRPGRLTDVGAVRGLQGEAEVLASVNHPAVARLLQPGLDAERPHIVLELEDGPRLSTLIRRFGPLARFALAEVFFRNPGQVLSREQLLSLVWGYDRDPGSNVVDVYVGYLRKKLGDGTIETVRGMGYRLVA